MTHSKFMPLLFLAILVMAMMMAYLALIEPMIATIANTLSHANIRHGSDADLARSCAGKGGYLFHNPTTNRYGNVCQINDAFGVVITDDKGNEITAFMKNKMHRFDQVLQYMKNSGYNLIQ